MRNNMITTLAEDYVRMGRAKGLSNRRIMYDYAARNAFLPNLSGFAMSLGFVHLRRDPGRVRLQLPGPRATCSTTRCRTPTIR